MKLLTTINQKKNNKKNRCGTMNMLSLSHPQLLSILIAPMITGSISTVASATIIVSIFRSEVKLSTIYRCFIFAMSTFDVIHSLPQLLSSLPMPANTTWGAIGNTITCGIQGFMTVLGFSGSALYSLSLTVYFLLVIKHEMKDAKIKQQYERLLHAIPILYALSISIVIYATHNYNPSDIICRVEARPANCDDDPEIPCESYGNVKIMIWIAGSIPLFAGGGINIILLGMIWWTMRSKTRKSQDRRMSWTTPSNAQLEQQQDQGQGQGMCQEVTIKCWNKILRRKETILSTIPTSVLAARLSRPSQASIIRMKDTSHRAIFYIIAFIATNLFTTIKVLIELNSSNAPPFSIILLARLTFPLQGFFNMLVYTYPHVQSYYRNRSDVSCFRAFVQVIKSGGDSDQIARAMSDNSGRRQSIHKKQRVLEQSENKRRRHSMIDQAHNKDRNSLLDMGATGLGEEVKMDIDEEMQEERLIESLYGIKSKHENIGDC